MVGARRTNGRVGPVRVKALAGGVFRLASPWPAGAVVRRRRGRPQAPAGPVLAVALAKGETAEIVGA